MTAGPAGILIKKASPFDNKSRQTKMKLPIRVILTAAIATATLAACAGKTKPAPTGPETTTTTTTTQAAPPTTGYKPGDLDTDQCLRQRVVYFDFDKTDIKSQFQAQIACHAKYLHQFPGARVTLEG